MADAPILPGITFGPNGEVLINLGPLGEAWKKELLKGVNVKLSPVTTTVTPDPVDTLCPCKAKS